MAVDLKPLVTLLAIVNPLACVPFFIHYTQHFSRQQRQHTIVIASFSAFVVIAVSALLGLQILDFFGISLASLCGPVYPFQRPALVPCLLTTHDTGQNIINLAA